MMDLKLLPSARHQEVTGRPNARILENARRLARTGVPMIFRTPVVPSVNDTDEEIGAIAAFIRAMADERSSNGHARGGPSVMNCSRSTRWQRTSTGASEWSPPPRG